MKHSIHENGKVVLIFALVAGLFMLPRTSIANDLNTCMSEMMHQVSDSMTIGELRLECEKQIQIGVYLEKDKQVSAVSERLRQDKKIFLNLLPLWRINRTIS